MCGNLLSLATERRTVWQIEERESMSCTCTCAMLDHSGLLRMLLPQQVGVVTVKDLFMYDVVGVLVK